MITITIDGWAWTWKWTTAKWVAKALGYQYIDTWAMYRWIALQTLKDWHDPANESQVVQSTKKLQFSYEYNTITDNFDLLINEVNSESKIRTPEVSAICHITAQYPEARKHLIQQQQELGKQWGAVFDGRDGWTVIAPHAELKVHLICDLQVRAFRRQEQYKLQWKSVDLEEIKKNLYERDQKDLYGPNATNSIAHNARELDTTTMTIDQQIQKIVDWVNE
jgi:cytidylate kinase